MSELINEVLDNSTETEDSKFQRPPESLESQVSEQTSTVDIAPNDRIANVTEQTEEGHVNEHPEEVAGVADDEGSDGEQSASPETTEMPDAVVEDVRIESKEQAEQARNTANQLMKDGEFEKGIDLYSAICKYYVRTYGPHAEECAIHYYDYGEAIVYALQELADGCIHQESGKAGDITGDIPLAWEALELAMQLYERKLEDLTTKGAPADELRDTELTLANVRCKLGDVSMEDENFSAAVEDYTKCLHLRQKHLSPGDRPLAEVLFLLGLAFENLNEASLALEHYRQAHAALAVNPANADLAQDVANKVEDMEMECTKSAAQEEMEKAMLREVISGLAPSLANPEQTKVPLSSLTPLQLQTQSITMLRDLAVQHGVDITDCCEKADLIERLVKAGQAQSTLTSADLPVSSSSCSASNSDPMAAPPAAKAVAKLAPRKRVRIINAEESEEPKATKQCTEGDAN